MPFCLQPFFAHWGEIPSHRIRPLFNHIEIAYFITKIKMFKKRRLKTGKSNWFSRLILSNSFGYFALVPFPFSFLCYLVAFDLFWLFAFAMWASASHFFSFSLTIIWASVFFFCFVVTFRFWYYTSHSVFLWILLCLRRLLIFAGEPLRLSELQEWGDGKRTTIEQKGERNWKQSHRS